MNLEKSNMEESTMFNKSAIMSHAWRICRKYKTTFSEALHRAWNAAKAEAINLERVRAAAAGILEELRTWYDWKCAGYEVRHGSKAMFQVNLIDAARGDGKTFRQSFFGASQVDRITA